MFSGVDDTRNCQASCRVSCLCALPVRCSAACARQALYGEDKPRSLPATYAIHPMTTGYTRRGRHFYNAALSTHQHHDALCARALLRLGLWLLATPPMTRHAMLTELVVRISA
ncbi:hypothetical protein SAMN05414139_03062 [Burkholderia sp. D7]|nr:hypothetical protein SAMN05414139_03062 [Burkholderia sp. D7]